MTQALKYTGTKLFRATKTAKPIDPGSTIKDEKAAKSHGTTLDYLAGRDDFVPEAPKTQTKKTAKGK